jgi:hypothetical protein
MSLMRHISVARIAVVAITLGSACSGAPDEHRTFVNRNAERELICEIRNQCRYITSALTFRDADGDVATGRASEVSFHGILLDAEAECGGVGKAWLAEGFRLENFELIEPFQLVLTDGSSLQLMPEAAIVIDNRNACYDEVGRWEGVAGSLRGRSGTYRWIDDTLQTELTLSGR